MTKERSLIVIGSGGFARTVTDTASELKMTIEGIIDLNFKDQLEEIHNIRVIGGLDKLDKFDRNEIVLIIAIGDNDKRKKVYEDLVKEGYKFTSIIHPTAHISKVNVEIGDAVFIGAQSIIMSDVSIGKNTVIYSGGIIEHETIINNHCFISPGVKIAGRVKVENNVKIGIGSNIIENLTIGNNSIIGAGSVVVKSIPNDVIVAGVPAKALK